MYLLIVKQVGSSEPKNDLKIKKGKRVVAMATTLLPILMLKTSHIKNWENCLMATQIEKNDNYYKKNTDKPIIIY